MILASCSAAILAAAWAKAVHYSHSFPGDGTTDDHPCLSAD
jgi:hypothetical protein